MTDSRGRYLRLGPAPYLTDDQLTHAADRVAADSVNAAVAAVVAVISVVTMAIDHLIGTESERDESQSAEPIAFVTTTALALGRPQCSSATSSGGRSPPAERRDEGDRLQRSRRRDCTAALRRRAVSLAGAGIALGLMGRDGSRRGLSTAAVVVGALVLALGLGVYVAAAL